MSTFMILVVDRVFDDTKSISTIKKHNSNTRVVGFLMKEQKKCRIATIFGSIEKFAGGIFNDVKSISIITKHDLNTCATIFY